MERSPHGRQANALETSFVEVPAADVRAEVARSLAGIPPYTEQGRLRLRAAVQRLNVEAISQELGLADIGSFAINIPRQPFCYFLPIGFDIATPPPLLIWFHDASQHEVVLKSIMPHIGIDRFAALAYRASRGNDSRSDQYDWSAADIGTTEDLLFDHLAFVESMGVANTQRVFLGGQGVGGTVAIDLALRSPNRFCGIISVGGQFSTRARRLGALSGGETPPLLLIHGIDSQRFSTNAVADLIRYLFVARIPSVLRQYPCGDELTLAELQDVGAWMNEVLNKKREQGGTPIVSVFNSKVAGEPVWQLS